MDSQILYGYVLIEDTLEELRQYSYANILLNSINGIIFPSKQRFYYEDYYFYNKIVVKEYKISDRIVRYSFGVMRRRRPDG